MRALLAEDTLSNLILKRIIVSIKYLFTASEAWLHLRAIYYRCGIQYCLYNYLLLVVQQLLIPWQLSLGFVTRLEAYLISQICATEQAGIVNGLIGSMIVQIPTLTFAHDDVNSMDSIGGEKSVKVNNVIALTAL